jgi:hypothetical protein
VELEASTTRGSHELTTAAYDKLGAGSSGFAGPATVVSVIDMNG